MKGRSRFRMLLIPLGLILCFAMFLAARLDVFKEYGLESAEKAFFASVAVKEVLSEPPVTIPADASIGEAARAMVEKKIGCLPVLDGDKLVGLITETDILKQVSEVEEAG